MDIFNKGYPINGNGMYGKCKGVAVHNMRAPIV